MRRRDVGRLAGAHRASSRATTDPTEFTLGQIEQDHHFAFEALESVQRVENHAARARARWPPPLIEVHKLEAAGPMVAGER